VELAEVRARRALLAYHQTIISRCVMCPTRSSRIGRTRFREQQQLLARSAAEALRPTTVRYQAAPRFTSKCSTPTRALHCAARAGPSSVNNYARCAIYRALGGGWSMKRHGRATLQLRSGAQYSQLCEDNRAEG